MNGYMYLISGAFASLIACLLKNPQGYPVIPAGMAAEVPYRRMLGKVRKAFAPILIAAFILTVANVGVATFCFLAADGNPTVKMLNATWVVMISFGLTSILAQFYLVAAMDLKQIRGAVASFHESRQAHAMNALRVRDAKARTAPAPATSEYVN